MQAHSLLEAYLDGSKVKIKQSAWEKYLKYEGLPLDKPNMSPQIIIAMPSNPPFHESCLLSFPFFWFKETDLELA